MANEKTVRLYCQTIHAVPTNKETEFLVGKMFTPDHAKALLDDPMSGWTDKAPKQETKLTLKGDGNHVIEPVSKK